MSKGFHQLERTSAKNAHASVLFARVSENDVNVCKQISSLYINKAVADPGKESGGGGGGPLIWGKKETITEEIKAGKGRKTKQSPLPSILGSRFGFVTDEELKNFFVF